MQGYIFQSQTIHFPECLVCIGNIDILEFQILHFTEEFGTINTTATHHQVVGIPDG